MNYEDLLLEKKDGIATITLNAPDKMNAITEKMKESLPLAIDEVAKDDGVRAVIVTGAGRAFCAGVLALAHNIHRTRSRLIFERGRQMIIVENPEACTGCLICEMACSFHHVRKFSGSQSSIKVNKSIFNPEKGAQITVFYEKVKGNPVCDLCKGEETPLCIRFCPENVFRLARGQA